MVLQHNSFRKHVEENLLIVRALIYQVAKYIAETGMPFPDGEFVKNG